MGVPAFYKWLSSKYPKTVVYAKEETGNVDASQANPNGREFDNLYLDMNGIIHPASHPEDGEAPETEDDMYVAIFEYLERVFRVVRPRKLLYMAIDGVAPRAKMNQQRSRRFRSAQEAQEKEEQIDALMEQWRAEGRDLPDIKGQNFDTNVITPGTPFMDRLAEYLKVFIHMKISDDAAWRGIKVILSDATVPGEGEHKIMEYIRLQRGLAGYNPNTSHVIHGLDADLIMLALATHEPQFSILREEVTFGKIMAKCVMCGQTGHSVDDCTGAPSNPDGTKGDEDAEEDMVTAKPFQFLHINILREYLFKEMQSGDYRCVGGFNLERVIDDFVFMCFFIGNDFLPHLPSLEIREGAIDTLLDMYKRCFPKFGGYLTENGDVNLVRVQVILQELATIEDKILSKRRSQEERFKQKKVDIKNKTTTQLHLKLIRQLTSNIAHHAVAVNSDQHHVKRQRSDLRAGYDNDLSHLGGKRLEEITANDFRIKNRTVGGGRSIAPGASPDDARKLAILDRIRQFFDDDQNKDPVLQLHDLQGRERALAHSYCDELGLRHDSMGTDNRRYIVVTRPDSESDVDAETEFEKEITGKIRSKGDEIVKSQPDTVELGRAGWKDRYYEQKFDGKVSPEEITKAYVEGLVWVMKYYYSGCPSWGWFYPYHYAPFPSDFINLGAMNPQFDQGTPFKPFEQLMAVFPARSGDALPPAFRVLMREDSPIGDFYPTKFDIDMNGKRYAWQAVVLLPFIDEKRLLTELKAVEHTLEPEDKRRNSVGATYLFVHDTHPLGQNQLHQLRFPGEGAHFPPPTEQEINDVAAKMLRAEMSGDKAAHSSLAAELQTLRRAVVEAEKFKLQLNPEFSHGMNGTVHLSKEKSIKIGDMINAPQFHGKGDNPLRNLKNEVWSVVYELPTKHPHIPSILPGAQIPAPVLLPEDRPESQRFTSTKAGGSEKIQLMCHQFQRGRCSYGDDCKFLHSQPRPPTNPETAARMISRNINQATHLQPRGGGVNHGGNYGGNNGGRGGGYRNQPRGGGGYHQGSSGGYQSGGGNYGRQHGGYGGQQGGQYNQPHGGQYGGYNQRGGYGGPPAAPPAAPPTYGGQPGNYNGGYTNQQQQRSQHQYQQRPPHDPNGGSSRQPPSFGRSSGGRYQPYQRH